ncbi:MAG TPA: D-alanine--D-alanine ligase [Rhodospirillaceae bacterium]|nr:D-alanine--D-alanine ligase [Candidatus Neomarinimicrobiota bacterium]HCX14816.1 D-alanine--D-alanine ligase [Rhodospirillaceae bacterium]|tara:strand:+ start:267 stop:1190 length:924 start_codon:yes stop_codon:yes gene_type:complete
MKRNLNINRISVLYGGFSKEREISLISGQAAIRALKAKGFKVTAIDITRDVHEIVSALNDTKPDVVFNALHGRFGEDGCIQGLLDMMSIPYTSSGRLASATSMNKPAAKRLFSLAGIPVAQERIVTVAEAKKGDVMARPYVLKPINEGSSVGVKIIRDGDNRMPLRDLGLADSDFIMAEEFIPGRELTVAVMGNKSLAVTEITTDRGFYDYEAKYTDAGSVHVLPAPLDKTLYDRAMKLSLNAHNALGCRGISRTDLRFDGNEFYILEVNTQPGLTPTSLVPEQALHVGISFEDLALWMVEHAQCDV